MHNSTVSFRAQARTIDHLGKGQIADCPTAVSELWKNSYDAYARNVALHTYDSKQKCGSIIDDGCGMTMGQLTNSWLVVGTNSKTSKSVLSAVDRFGLPPRQVQGEKGIGRLSSAFLAPITLLVSKKINSNFVSALIDWRLFENPYLSLSDILIPLNEFEDISEIPKIFKSQKERLLQNLCVTPRPDLPKEKFDEISSFWERFSADEASLSDNPGSVQTTRKKISDFCLNFELPANLFDAWESMLIDSEKRDGSSHGTALFLLDLERDLSLLTNSEDLSRQNFEVEKIKYDLVDTLRAFVDPFLPNEEFKYEIKIFGESESMLLRQSDVFNLEDFLALEHVVQGTVDEKGWFTGNVKAFNKDMGIFKIPPSIELDGGKTKVGRFQINLGTFENEPDLTSHSEHDFAQLSAQTNKYTGLMIFRDGLRVLPYGRADNDFFEIEERRGKNAGRYYWARRRIFGQILISQDENSQLRDKAGREGFIKNRAARELRALVETILTALADNFYGKKSDARTELLQIVRKERESRKEAQSKARVQTLRSFLEDLKRQDPILAEQLKVARDIHTMMDQVDSPTNDLLDSWDAQLSILESVRADLRPPTKPAKLGDHEEKYRAYRDNYAEFVAYVLNIRTNINKFTSLRTTDPVQVARKSFERNQGLLSSKISRSLMIISTRLDSFSRKWEREGNQDRGLYYQKALPHVESTSTQNLETTLNSLDAIYNDFSDTFSIKYDAVAQALERLENGVNLSAAFSMAEEEKVYFEKKSRDLQALAQLGISVEILGHELESLDAQVTAGLNSLPSGVKDHPGYKLASNAHRSLTHQIRFLSPLKLSGYQSRKDITGQEIRQHIEHFFADRFEKQRVQMTYGELFLDMKIKDLPSRIFPVFINILNNALYWVSLVSDRRIQIDVLDDEVVIANSGPPVDEDDVDKLFEIFYTNRSNGHGVGLYLCKENLAVAHHKIRYLRRGEPSLISGGANFAITFNGMMS